MCLVQNGPLGNNQGMNAFLPSRGPMEGSSCWLPPTGTSMRSEVLALIHHNPRVFLGGGMRAAGYVAMSYVKGDEDYLIGGYVTRRHFTPAT